MYQDVILCVHYIDNHQPLYSPSRNLQSLASCSLSEQPLLARRERHCMQEVAREVRGSPSMEGEGGGDSKSGERRAIRSSENPSSINCSWSERSVECEKENLHVHKYMQLVWGSDWPAIYHIVIQWCICTLTHVRLYYIAGNIGGN